MPNRSLRFWLARATASLVLAMSGQFTQAQVTTAYVTDLQLVSSTRVTSTLTDFVYRIRLTNQGPALQGASATVQSLAAATEIRDNDVFLGDVAAGTTITSTDTFTLRQNRAVAFNPGNLVWTVRAVAANTPPVADAGADQTVRTGTVITLDGTRSSDADGQSLRYSWTLASRPAGSAAALTGSATPRPVFTVDRGGNYLFRLVVNDGQVDSVADEVQISTLNSAPVAEAGADRTVARGSLVTLDGLGSTDPDFDSLSYTWAIVGQPNASTAALTGATTGQPQIRLDQPGDYRFRLVVADATLESAPDFVNISTLNSIPVANAGPSQTGAPGSPVTLDGHASHDADGDAVAFFWSWASRPQGSAAVLDLSDLLHPTFTPDSYGDYVVQLIVNDGWADSLAATTTVAVPRPPNRAPHAAADSASTTTNTPVDVAVLANDSDPDGDALSIQSFTQSANGQVSLSGARLRFTPASNFTGTATFDYVVSDGSLTSTASVTVTVNGTGNTNTAPVVSAGADQTRAAAFSNALVSVQLAGSVNDDGLPQPGALTLSWSQIAGPAQALIALHGSASTTVQMQTPGTYQFRLSASDGALSAADDVLVTISQAGNTAPVLAPIGNRTLRPGEVLQLQVAASDSDPFDTLSYTLGASPAGATLSATGALSWTAGAAGTTSFTIRVRDQGGLESSTSFSATVLAANRPPVLGPLANDTTRVGANYSKPVAATDPDGGAVTLSLLGAPAGLTLNGNTLSWRPGASQTGAFSVRVLATDSTGATAAGAFGITVQAATPPLARDDVYAVQVGQTLNVDAPGVLANDGSADGASLAAHRRSDPALGTVNSFDSNGSFSYTAPAVDPRPPFTLSGSILTSDPNVGEDLLDWSPLGDLDRDGRPDLITGRFNGFRIIATSGGTGNRLWGTNPPCQWSPNDSPADLLADIDDDGHLEYISVTRCAGEGGGNFGAWTRLQALNDNGQVKWTSDPLSRPNFYIPCSSPGVCEANPRLADFDMARNIILSTARLAPGESPVLMFRQYIPPEAGAAYTRLDDGTYNWKNFGCQMGTGDVADAGRACMVTMLVSPVDGSVQQVLKTSPRRGGSDGSNNPYARNAVVAVDLDGDGSIELVSGADVWRRSGNTWSLAWQSPAEPEQVAVADMDGDGKPEIIQHVAYPDNYDPADPMRAAFSGLVIYSGSGVELHRIPLTTTRSGTLVVADVDGDGLPEMLITQGGIAYAFAGDGTLKWTYQVPDDPASPQAPLYRTTDNTNMIAYDLDGDGNKEVILSALGWVLFLDGRTGLEKARFATGQQPRSDVSGKVFVTDWDNDGHADVIVVNVRGSYGAGTSEAGYVIRSSRNDWLPAPKFFGQFDFRASSFDAAGRVLYDPSAPREFRNPQQLGTVRDPRESTGTSFTYVANDGQTESAPARVFVGIEPANRPPVITSTPPTAVLGGPGRAYRVVYRVLANDPDQGDTLSYSLAGFTNAYGFPAPIINAATGDVSVYTTDEAYEYTTELFVTVTDSRGAMATQSFIVTNTNVGIAVPDVVGQPAAAAAAALTAKGLQNRVSQQQFSASIPAGAVVSQNPIAGANVPRLGTVSLVVSKGPQPVIVPNVVGRPAGSAAALLSAAGFTPAVTRQYSDTVPVGTIISQTPAGGGEAAPGTANMVVSLGSGIVVRLDRDFVASNQTIAARVTGIAPDGTETTFPGAMLTVAALPGPVQGAAPTLSGNTLSFAASTRGAFRLTATDTLTGRSGSADFVVAAPATAATRPDVLAIATFGETLAAVGDLMRQASAASDAGTRRARVISAVQRWRAFNQSVLRLSTPFAPEGGLPPLPRDLTERGMSASSEDQVNLVMLENGVARVRELIDALRQPSTPIAEIERRFAELSAAVSGLALNQPGEFGLVMAQPEYRYLISRLLPDWMNALMNEMALATGQPALVQQVEPSTSGRTAYVASLLAEELTTITVNSVLDQINFIGKFKTDVTTQAYRGAMLVGLASHLRAMLAGQELVEVVGGASLSIRRFAAPYSFIEGFDFDVKYPILNNVVFLGPETVGAVTDLADAIKNLKLGDMAASVKAFFDLKSKVEALRDAGDPFAGNALQVPTDAEVGCVFTTAPSCAELHFASGFFPVYSYNAPPPLPPSVVGLPSPIIVIAMSTTGQFYLSTPPFIPYRPGED